MKKFLIVLVVVMLAGCENSNLTTLTDKGVSARTSTANVASMDSEGNLRASFNGVGPTQSMLDPNGIWTNTPGPGMHLSAQFPGFGVAQIFSPKDVTIESLTYTPKPEAGKPMLTVNGFSANMTAPLSQQVEAVKAALPVLQAMTQAEALATVEKWRIAGTMLPTVADMLKSLISAMWPVATVVP
jgi:hypothetical protein